MKTYTIIKHLTLKLEVKSTSFEHARDFAITPKDITFHVENLVGKYEIIENFNTKITLFVDPIIEKNTPKDIDVKVTLNDVGLASLQYELERDAIDQAQKAVKNIYTRVLGSKAKAEEALEFLTFGVPLLDMEITKITPLVGNRVKCQAIIKVQIWPYLN